MSDDVATRLRDLARERFEGRLTVAAYRRLRAPLIDSLVTRAETVDESEAITQPRPVGGRTVPAAASGPGGKRWFWRIAGIVTALLVIGALVWKFLPALQGEGTATMNSPAGAHP